MQLADYGSTTKDVDAAIRARQQWASKQQAACEWLIQEVHDHALDDSTSQLEELKKQVQSLLVNLLLAVDGLQLTYQLHV